MKELIDKITQKTGISGDQATKAVETVVGFLKEKLPAPIAGQLDRVLGGGGGDEESPSGLGGLAAGIGGAVGERKAG